MRSRLLVLAAFLIFAAGCGHRRPEPGVATSAAPDRQAARQRTEDILHTALAITVDIEAGTVSGSAEITWTAVDAPTDRLVLDAHDFTLGAVTRDGKSLQHHYDGEHLVLRLPKSLHRGETATVTIEYSCAPKTGMFFIRPDDKYPTHGPLAYTHGPLAYTQGEQEDNHFWFPCHDFPDDRMTTEIKVTAPSRFLTLSNGTLVLEAPAGDGWRTWHWKQEQDHVSYLVTLVVGDFDVRREEAEGVPLSYYVPKEFAERSARTFACTPDALKTFNEYLGVAYPWDKYAQICVIDFAFGGMENTSATTLTEFCLRDAESQLDEDSNGLIAHELMHQWFGDLVTCNDWSNLWLNEGFATFGNRMYDEANRGRLEYEHQVWNSFRNNAKPDRNLRPMLEYAYHHPGDLFDSYAYSRGADVIHMLRGVMGEANFRAGLTHYLETRKFTTATTDDLCNALSESSGEDLSWFFEQWCRGIGVPEYEVSYRYDESIHSLVMDVKQTQKTDALHPLFQMPVEIEITTQGEQGPEATLYTVHIGGRQQTVTLPCATSPLMVRFDKHGNILKRLNITKSRAEWAWQLQHDDSLNGRLNAAQALAGMKVGGKNDAALADNRSLAKLLIETYHALPPLEEGDRPFTGEREELLKALGKFGELDEVYELAMNEARNAHRRLRPAAVALLGRCKPKADEILSWFAQTLPTEKSNVVREAMVKAAGSLGGKDLYEFLTASLQYDSHRDDVRRAAVTALAQKFPKHEAVRELLFKGAERGNGSYLRTSCIRGMAKLDRADEEVNAALVGWLTDSNIHVRRAACETLAKRGAGSALPTLLALAAAEEVPAEATRLTRTIDDIRIWRAPLKIENDEDRGRRAAQLRALKKEYDDALQAVLDEPLSLPDMRVAYSRKRMQLEQDLKPRIEWLQSGLNKKGNDEEEED